MRLHNSIGIFVMSRVIRNVHNFSEILLGCLAYRIAPPTPLVTPSGGSAVESNCFIRGGSSGKHNR